jgi:hypothetical protein
MSAMYRAIQVTKPGEFEAVMKPMVDNRSEAFRLQRCWTVLVPGGARQNRSG